MSRFECQTLRPPSLPPPVMDYLHPGFESWWFDIRECVRNFGEIGAQRVDVPPIFQGDLTLKPLPKAKPSSTKRNKNVNTPSSKKLKVHFFLYSNCFVTSSLSLNSSNFSSFLYFLPLTGYKLCPSSFPQS